MNFIAFGEPKQSNDLFGYYTYSTYSTYTLTDYIKEAVTNTRQKYSAKYKLAGVKKENVKISYENDLVTVNVKQEGDYPFVYTDAFTLSFIPKTFDAKMEDGLLTLEILPEKIDPLTIKIK